MQRLFSFLAVIALALGVTSLLGACNGNSASLQDTVQQRGKLIAGVKYDSKPFGYLDTDGQLKGYDIDLMRELARRLFGDPQAVEFQQVLSSTRVVAINSGTVDLVAATMTITPAREQVIDFSIPYYTAHQAVLVPAHSVTQTLEDFNNGQRVLYVLGTTSEQTIRARIPQAKYIGFKTSTDAFSALKAGRGEAMTTDDTILWGFLADDCGFRLLSETLSDEHYGLGFKKTSGHNAFRDQINQHLRDMQADGTLDQLKARWIDAFKTSRACPGTP